MHRIVVLDQAGVPQWTGGGLTQLRRAAGVSCEWIAERAQLSTADIESVEQAPGPADSEIAGRILRVLRWELLGGEAPVLPQPALERLLRKADGIIEKKRRERDRLGRTPSSGRAGTGDAAEGEGR